MKPVSGRCSVIQLPSSSLPTEEQIVKLEKEINIPFDSSDKAIREHKEKLLNDKEKYFALWHKDVETLNFVKKMERPYRR